MNEGQSCVDRDRDRDRGMVVSRCDSFTVEVTHEEGYVPTMMMLGFSSFSLRPSPVIVPSQH